MCFLDVVVLLLFRGLVGLHCWWSVAGGGVLVVSLFVVGVVLFCCVVGLVGAGLFRYGACPDVWVGLAFFWVFSGYLPLVVSLFYCGDGYVLCGLFFFLPVVFFFFSLLGIYLIVLGVLLLCFSLQFFNSMCFGF